MDLILRRTQAALHRPCTARHVIHTGLDLHRFPGIEGDWLGVVNYEIGYVGNRREELHPVDKLVQVHVLRKRGQAR